MTEKLAMRLAGAACVSLAMVLIAIAAMSADSTDSAWPGVVILGALVVATAGVVMIARTFIMRPAAASPPPVLVGASMPAGWYPDPTSPSIRFWDGQTWTDQRAPLPYRGDDNRAGGGLQAVGILGAIFIPIVGFIIGIVLCTKRDGGGVGALCLVLSVISFFVWWSILSEPAYQTYGY